MTLAWFDSYEGPKILNRSAGQWKCILAGKCPVATAYGSTPEEAIQKAIEVGKQRKRVGVEIARQDAEREAELEEIAVLESWK